MTEAWVGGRITAALQRRIAVAMSGLVLEEGCDRRGAENCGA